MKPNRRELFAGAAAAALLAAEQREAEAASLPAPLYTLAVNLELMFPGSMPYETRLQQTIQAGAKHYCFWGWQGKNLDALMRLQEKHDMTLTSISGNPKTGWTTGFTRPGFEQQGLDDFAEVCAVAKRFGCGRLVSFVGQRYNDVPWEVQHAGIIAGLKKAGDIARQFDTLIVLEPLNHVESPQMTMLYANEAFQYAQEANHPHVRVNYDFYHRQLGEGNTIDNFRTGFGQGLIHYVEIGDVPGRFEPGTGEANYVNLFAQMRKLGYNGFIGMEHRTTRDVRYAWNTVRKLAGLE